MRTLRTSVAHCASSAYPTARMWGGGLVRCNTLNWANGSATGLDDVKRSKLSKGANGAMDELKRAVLQELKREALRAVKDRGVSLIRNVMSGKTKAMPPRMPKTTLVKKRYKDGPPAGGAPDVTVGADEMLPTDPTHGGFGVPRRMLARGGALHRIVVDAGDVYVPSASYATGKFYLAPQPMWEKWFEKMQGYSTYKIVGLAVRYIPNEEGPRDTVYGGRIIICPSYTYKTPDIANLSQARCGLHVEGSVNERIEYRYTASRVSRAEYMVPKQGYTPTTDNTGAGVTIFVTQPSGSAATAGTLLGRWQFEVTCLATDPVCVTDRAGSLFMQATGCSGTAPFGGTITAFSTTGYLSGTTVDKTSRKIAFGSTSPGDVIVVMAHYSGTAGVPSMAASTLVNCTDTPVFLAGGTNYGTANSSAISAGKFFTCQCLTVIGPDPTFAMSGSNAWCTNAELTLIAYILRSNTVITDMTSKVLTSVGHPRVLGNRGRSDHVELGGVMVHDVLRRGEMEETQSYADRASVGCPTVSSEGGGDVAPPIPPPQPPAPLPPENGMFPVLDDEDVDSMTLEDLKAILLTRRQPG